MMTKSEKAKLKYAKRKAREQQEKAEGWRKCSACDKKFIEAKDFLDDKYHYCSKACLLWRHSCRGGTYTGYFSGPSITECWIRDSDIHQKVIMTHYGGFRDDSLSNIATKAALEFGETPFDENNKDHLTFGCEYSGKCINPYHYRVITKSEIDAKLQKQEMLKEQEEKEEQEAKEQKEKEEREAKSLAELIHRTCQKQNELIVTIPPEFRVGFCRWHRNNLFAKLSNAIVTGDGDAIDNLRLLLCGLDPDMCEVCEDTKKRKYNYKQTYADEYD